MSFMVIAVAMLAAFCLQFLFQMVQMKSFNKYNTINLSYSAKI